MITAKLWKEDIKTAGIKKNLDMADRVTWLLQSYGQMSLGASGPDRIAERRRLLEQIRDYCDATTKDWTRVDRRLRYLMIGVGMLAVKDMATMDRAGAHWAKVRSVMAPSGCGATLMIKHLQNNLAAPTSAGNYWLEKLDPLHRSWGHKDKATTAGYFDQWLADTTSNLGFFDWIQAKGVAATWDRVEYLGVGERWKYAVVFGPDQRAYCNDGRDQTCMEPPLSLLSTANWKSCHSGDAFGIWVCSPNGVFYTYNHARSKFHHSSFLKGGRVKGAGEWVVSGGKVLMVTNKTGHYGASQYEMFACMKLLYSRVNLRRTVVCIENFDANTTKYTTAIDFLNKGGDISKCLDIKVNSRGLSISQLASVACKAGQDWDANAAPADTTYASAARVA